MSKTIRIMGCWRCDFCSGYRGMDRCPLCDGTGSVYVVQVSPGTMVAFPVTPEGEAQAKELADA